MTIYRSLSKEKSEVLSMTSYLVVLVVNRVMFVHFLTTLFQTDGSAEEAKKASQVTRLNYT